MDLFGDMMEAVTGVDLAEEVLDLGGSAIGAVARSDFGGIDGDDLLLGLGVGVVAAGVAGMGVLMMQHLDLLNQSGGHLDKRMAELPYQVNGNLKPCIGLFIGCRYPGSSAELAGCTNDLKQAIQTCQKLLGVRFKAIYIGVDDGTREDFFDIQDRQNIRVELFYPNRRNMESYYVRVLQEAAQDSFIWLHFSGHGGNQRDENGDEDDGRDETVIPSDYERNGVIVDDWLHDQIVQRNPDVSMVACFDCCHSGSMLDLEGWEQSKVVCMSGCQDDQTSADCSPSDPTKGAYGAFTTCLSRAILNMREESDNPMDINLDELESAVNHEIKELRCSQCSNITLSRTDIQSLGQVMYLPPQYQQNHVTYDQLPQSNFAYNPSAPPANNNQAPPANNYQMQSAPSGPSHYPMQQPAPQVNPAQMYLGRWERTKKPGKLAGTVQGNVIVLPDGERQNWSLRGQTLHTTAGYRANIVGNEMRWSDGDVWARPRGWQPPRPAVGPPSGPPPSTSSYSVGPPAGAPPPNQPYGAPQQPSHNPNYAVGPPSGPPPQNQPYGASQPNYGVTSVPQHQPYRPNVGPPSGAPPPSQPYGAQQQYRPPTNQPYGARPPQQSYGMTSVPQGNQYRPPQQQSAPYGAAPNVGPPTGRPPMNQPYGAQPPRPAYGAPPQQNYNPYGAPPQQQQYRPPNQSYTPGPPQGAPPPNQPYAQQTGGSAPYGASAQYGRQNTPQQYGRPPQQQYQNQYQNQYRR